jgi:N-acetylglutamate synthase-like GNAT family acetyltransferase
VYVAYLGGQPVGTVALQDVGGVGIVYDVQTAPRMRRRGAAATMVLHGLARAREAGLSPLFLLTPVEATAYQMYEKLGFAREGTLDGYLLSQAPNVPLTPG